MHLDGAEALVKECPESSWSKIAHEAIYLSGYGFECVLKAAILSRIPPKKHEETVGTFRTEVKHNLDRLRKVLSDHGLDLPHAQVVQLRSVRSEWTPEMRYVASSRSAEDAAFVHRSATGFYRWAERG
jgi:hypothetical protein